MTPKLYDLSVQTGQNKREIIRKIFIDHYSVNCAKMLTSEIDIILGECVLQEFIETGIPKKTIIKKIIERHLDNVSQQKPKSIPENDKIDILIEAKLREYSCNKSQKPRLKRRILSKSLGVSSARAKKTDALIDVALERRAKLVGRSKEDIVRDIFVQHFRIAR